MNLLAAIAIAVVLGFLIFALQYQERHPRKIVREGTLSVTSLRAGAQPMLLRTRAVEINGREFSEIELPGATWIGCEGDCAKAAREATDEFWDKVQRERP